MSDQDWTAPGGTEEALRRSPYVHPWKVDTDRDGISIWEVPEPIPNVRQSIRRIASCDSKRDAAYIVDLHEKHRRKS